MLDDLPDLPPLPRHALRLTPGERRIALRALLALPPARRRLGYYFLIDEVTGLTSLRGLLLPLHGLGFPDAATVAREALLDPLNDAGGPHETPEARYRRVIDALEREDPTPPTPAPDPPPPT